MPERVARGGVTRRGGVLLLILGVAMFFVGGALFAFVSASGIVTRFFPLLSLLGVAVALVGAKNVLLPSARRH